MIDRALLSLSKILLLLAVSSVWQAISGYAKVFSHRFVFTTVDPPVSITAACFPYRLNNLEGQSIITCPT